jgi:hypothetical protein
MAGASGGSRISFFKYFLKNEYMHEQSSIFRQKIIVLSNDVLIVLSFSASGIKACVIESED